MSSTIKAAIQAIKVRIADAYTAIQAKGGTLPATQDSANLPTAIASIPSGGLDYSAMSQLGFSQSDIQLIEDIYDPILAPTQADIDAAAPYINRSGNGSRAWQDSQNSFVFSLLKYLPSYTVTNGEIYQFFWKNTSAQICGGIKSSSAFTRTDRIFADNLEMAPNLRIILGDELDFSGSGSMYSAFACGASLIRIPAIKVSSLLTTMYRAFANCYALKSISITGDTSNVTTFAYAFINCMTLESINGVLDAASNTVFTDTFYFCYALKDMRLKNIGVNVNISYCSLLSYDSLLYLVQNVQNVSGKTITMGSTNIAKLNATADGQAAIAAAQAMGWTIA